MRGSGPNKNGNGHNNKPSNDLIQLNIDVAELSDPTLYKTKNDIQESARVALITILNQRLADAIDLQLQMKQAHWNVKGPDFFQLHILFDQLAGEVFPFIDLVAERITALGGVAKRRWWSR